MVKENLNIIWTQNAKRSLKNIYDFYQPKSTKAAKKIIEEILQTAKNIQFAEQFKWMKLTTDTEEWLSVILKFYILTKKK
jgi:hypothetical protein